MADLPRNIPSAMTNFRGYITGRMTDRSASFFNLRAPVYKPAGKNKHKNKFHSD
jgi:hypothetical protein